MYMLGYDAYMYEYAKTLMLPKPKIGDVLLFTVSNHA